MNVQAIREVDVIIKLECARVNLDSLVRTALWCNVLEKFVTVLW